MLKHLNTTKTRRQFLLCFRTIKQSLTTTHNVQLCSQYSPDLSSSSQYCLQVHSRGDCIPRDPQCLHQFRPRGACVYTVIRPSTFISTKDVLVYLSTLRSIQLCLHSNARFHPVPSRMFLYIPNDFLVMSSSSSYVQFIQVCPHRSFQFIQVCSHRSIQIHPDPSKRCLCIPSISQCSVHAKMFFIHCSYDSTCSFIHSF